MNLTLQSLCAASLLLLGCTSSTPDAGDLQPQPDAVRDVGVDHHRHDFGVDRAADIAPADLVVDATPDKKPCLDPGVMLENGVVVAPTSLLAGQLVSITYPPSAPLGASASLTLHYGINYWSTNQQGVVATDAPMSKLANGSFEATITIPAGARLLDFVFFTEVGSDKKWDNNDSKDYHRSVGVPLIGPYLTLRDNTAPAAPNDPAQGVTVSFKTDRACLGQVSYGPSAAGPTTSASGANASLFHHIRIDNLAPDTTYHYRVSCIDPTAACPIVDNSPAYSFRTAPVDPEAFKFLVLSDPQDNRQPADLWADIASALANGPHSDARFILMTGDLAGNDFPDKWWDFFDKGRLLLASKPMMAAVGNHDTPTDSSNGDTTRFESLFDFHSSSGQPTYYAFSYGTASFIVLNSETSEVSASDWKPGGPQYSWAANKLATLPGPWRFAAWHIPPFNAGARHGGQRQTRDVAKLLDGRIDWVFSGHEHMYQRTKPLQHDEAGAVKVVGSYGTSQSEGVGYILAPAAGHDPPETALVGAAAPERVLLAHPAPAQIVDDKTDPWVGFITVEVNAMALTIRAWAHKESTPRDEVSYSKQ